MVSSSCYVASHATLQRREIGLQKFVPSKSAMRMDRMFADTESEEVESGIRVDMAEDMA